MTTLTFFYNTKVELYNTKVELYNTKVELYNTKIELYNTKVEFRFIYSFMNNLLKVNNFTVAGIYKCKKLNTYCAVVSEVSSFMGNRVYKLLKSHITNIFSTGQVHIYHISGFILVLYHMKVEFGTFVWILLILPDD